MKVTTTVEMSDKRTADMLCGAREGGSNFWIIRITVKSPSEPYTVESYEDFPAYAAPLSPDGAWMIKHEATKEGGPDVVTSILNREALERGWQVMAEKYPKHFADVLNESDDANTADLFVQCCLFGEEVFG